MKLDAPNAAATPTLAAPTAPATTAPRIAAGIYRGQEFVWRRDFATIIIMRPRSLIAAAALGFIAGCTPQTVGVQSTPAPVPTDLPFTVDVDASAASVDVVQFPVCRLGRVRLEGQDQFRSALLAAAAERLRGTRGLRAIRVTLESVDARLEPLSTGLSSVRATGRITMAARVSVDSSTGSPRPFTASAARTAIVTDTGACSQISSAVDQAFQLATRDIVEEITERVRGAR